MATTSALTFLLLELLVYLIVSVFFKLFFYSENFLENALTNRMIEVKQQATKPPRIPYLKIAAFKSLDSIIELFYKKTKTKKRKATATFKSMPKLSILLL